MGLTLVRRGDGPPKKDPKIALVLAGGAVSGGAFKVGGLKALDDFLVGRGVTDLDVYADFFAMNPIAFWNRAEAMRHGFESVHETLHKNFGELSDVLGRYGLQMSRSAARQKAEQLRVERWPEREAVRSDPSLRLVGS